MCLVPFLFAYRRAERRRRRQRRRLVDGSRWPCRSAEPSQSGGMAIIADEAFPVQGEVVAEPAFGVALLAAGALVLRVNPLHPLLSRAYAFRTEFDPPPHSHDATPDPAYLPSSGAS